MSVMPGLATLLSRPGKVPASVEDVGVAVGFLLVEEPEARDVLAVLSVRFEALPGLVAAAAGED